MELEESLPPSQGSYTGSYSDPGESYNLPWYFYRNHFNSILPSTPSCFPDKIVFPFLFDFIYDRSVFILWHFWKGVSDVSILLMFSLVFLPFIWRRFHPQAIYRRVVEWMSTRGLIEVLVRQLPGEYEENRERPRHADVWMSRGIPWNILNLGNA
jgi:hypothetical protein